MLPGMTRLAAQCVLLANRHHRLIEGVRDMLESCTDSLFIVASEKSLLEGASRLQPAIVILDLSLVPGHLREIIQCLRTSAPGTKTVLLSSHDEASAARFLLGSQADGVVLKHFLATDLLPAIEAVLAGRVYVSPGIRRPPRDDQGPIPGGDP
jgi:DNA-binding NarL/FixJ family response regulator